MTTVPRFLSAGLVYILHLLGRNVLFICCADFRCYLEPAACYLTVIILYIILYNAVHYKCVFLLLIAFILNNMIVVVYLL